MRLHLFLIFRRLIFSLFVVETPRPVRDTASFPYVIRAGVVISVIRLVSVLSIARHAFR